MEEICSAGPGGEYMDSDHTKKFAAALWQPTLMDRQSYENWATQGKTTMRDRVIEKARDIIASFEGPISKVPEDAKKKIAEILQAAEAREAKKPSQSKTPFILRFKLKPNRSAGRQQASGRFHTKKSSATGLKTRTSFAWLAIGIMEQWNDGMVVFLKDIWLILYSL